ncbi:MAG: hypothetical protein CM1200mP26_02180 [Acidimicrobiales bacterium]|nr:MAG: hypothetical protein CM1200mP26_02180 [Acidimicrobiales bacterium]
MPLSAVLLVLASTVLHAGWNTRLHRGSDPEVVIALAYLFVGIVLVPAAVVDPPGEVLGWVLARRFPRACTWACWDRRTGPGALAWPIRSRAARRHY